MRPSIDFYFDFGSPASYLAYTQMPILAEETGAQVNYKPVLLGGIFKMVGNTPPGALKPKGRYMTIDLKRYAERYGVPFAMNPHFPVNTLALMRGATAVQADQPDRFLPFCDALFKAMWVDGKNLNDPAVVGSTLAEAGFDPSAMMTAIQDQSVKDKLKAETEAAAARGIFGLPTMFVGEEMFFGQDRLDFVREYAARG
ncbi:MAG: 2-hydroxychromene-2-carboxylate isomerase [Acidobacteriota bacterium]|nr:2-hydroxychromene-2-carboxylate isomerase [Acidobacteriota bacterium]